MTIERHIYIDSIGGDDAPSRDGSSCEPLRTFRELARRGPYCQPLVVHVLADTSPEDPIAWADSHGNVDPKFSSCNVLVVGETKADALNLKKEGAK